MQAAEIQKMSLPERLRAMEMLWDALARDAEAVPSPAWHGTVLEDRLERVRRGQATFLTLEEVKKRLGR